jgi:hypothetical protein
MSRLAVALLSLSLLAAPLATGAQPMGKPLPRVALVSPTGEPAAMTESQSPYVRAFVQGLRELGWTEGPNIVIERRSAEGKFERLPELFAELVRLKADVIVTVNRLARVAKQATTTIPIVIAPGYGLVANGLVASLARPGGNVTGLDFEEAPGVEAKRLQLLKEVAGCRRCSTIQPRTEGRPHGISWERRRIRPARCRPSGQDPEGRQARRRAGGAAYEVRARDQFEDGEGAGPDDSALGADAGG